MRSFGFFGSPMRNDPIELVDPRPLPRYTMEDMETGDAAEDGYTIVSRSHAGSQGSPPSPSGVVGPTYRGPSMDWEQ